MIDVANTIVRGRRWIAAGILLLGILILPFAHHSSQKLVVGGSTVDRSEAEYVDELLDTEFKICDIRRRTDRQPQILSRSRGKEFVVCRVGQVPGVGVHRIGVKRPGSVPEITSQSRARG